MMKDKVVEGFQVIQLGDSLQGIIPGDKVCLFCELKGVVYKRQAGTLIVLCRTQVPRNYIQLIQLSCVRSLSLNSVDERTLSPFFSKLFGKYREYDNFLKKHGM